MEFTLDVSGRQFAVSAVIAKPGEIPSKVGKVKATPRAVLEILRLPIKELTGWMEAIDDFTFTFGNFWFLIRRFEGGKLESGDGESYEKAKLILDGLIRQKKEGKPVHQENLRIDLNYLSYEPRKVDLLKKAIEKLEIPLDNSPIVKSNRWRDQTLTDDINAWLNKRRDPEKIINMSQFEVADEEGDEKPKKDFKGKKPSLQHRTFEKKNSREYPPREQKTRWGDDDPNKGSSSKPRRTAKEPIN